MAQVFLTTTGAQTWTVPSDFNPVNTIEVIGAGGGGGGGEAAGAARDGGGGGGGGYSKVSNLNLTPGASINYTVGTGGSGGATGSDGVSGGDSWFNGTTLGGASLGCAGGAKGIYGGSAGAGGVGSTGTGSGATTHKGGNGGTGNVTPNVNGGGGAAGLNGDGNTRSGSSGGSGDAGFGGAGGAIQANGGNGTEYDGSHGSGGGAGAAGGSFTGGSYGGAGGGGAGGGGGPGHGDSGAQALIVITYTPTVSNPRYWVGGAGTWDLTSTTHWSASSGGASGASAPVGVTTDVFFDANSGAGTVTFTTGIPGINLTFTGFTGTFAGSTGMSLSGNLTLASGMTLSYTGAFTFSATTTGKTITTAGKSIPTGIIFNGSGGGWTLQDNMTVPSVTLTNGTLSLAATTVSLNGTGTVWNATSGTISAGTSTVKLTDASASAKTFSGSGLTYNNFYITGSGSGAYTISGNNTFNDFKIDTPPHTVNFTAGSTQLLQTWTVSGTAGNLMTLQSTSAGSPWFLQKITSGSVSSDYLSLQDSHVS